MISKFYGETIVEKGSFNVHENSYVNNSFQFSMEIKRKFHFMVINFHILWTFRGEKVH